MDSRPEHIKAVAEAALGRLGIASSPLGQGFLTGTVNEQTRLDQTGGDEIGDFYGGSVVTQNNPVTGADIVTPGLLVPG